MLLGIVILVVGLVVSIALHEVGHMVPAKRFGVRVSQYMVGFGPTLWSRTRGETEYGVKAFPLGGYVRLIGMYPPAASLDRPPRPGRFAEAIDDARRASAEEIRPGEDHRAFYRLSTPKKVVVMLGGPTMNLVIAAVLIAVVYMGIGIPGSTTTTVAMVAPCVPATASANCTDGQPASPASEAGLRVGDTVLSYGGIPTSTWPEVQHAIRTVGGEDVPMVVRRDGAEVTLRVDPVTTERLQWNEDGTPLLGADGKQETAPTRYLGFGPSQAIERQSFGTAMSAVGTTVWETGKVLVLLPAKVVDVGKAVLGLEERDRNSVVGVVGVARLAGEIGEADLGVAQRVASWLGLLASLNIALFMFNLIPLVPLDGGHVAGALWEGAKRTWARARGLALPGPADLARMVPVAYGVAMVLIALTVVLVVADIAVPVTI